MLQASLEAFNPVGNLEASSKPEAVIVEDEPHGALDAGAPVGCLEHAWPIVGRLEVLP